MKAVTLKPIIDNPDEWLPLKKVIAKLFREEIYEPLLLELGEPKSSIQNSTDSLNKAIQSGRIKFNRGKFTGRFTSATSRELKALGAKWNKLTGSWDILLKELPADLYSQITVSESRFMRAIQKINKRLADFIPEKLIGKLQIEDILDTTLLKTDKKFKETTKSLGVQPTLTPERRAKIADLYTENLERYIKDFTEEETLKLRSEIKKHVSDGGRYEEIAKTIQKSYGVSERKALFLARQETKLMTTALKQERYLDAGVSKYKWKCVSMPKSSSPTDNKPGYVRYTHAKLNDTIQDWNHAPITDEKGSRNHPGEDYNCRCYAIPIVEFKK